MQPSKVRPYGEVAYSTVVGGAIGGSQVEGRDLIVWIERHPDTVSAHDFQNPAFDRIKKEIITEYLERNGEYP